MKTTSKSMDVDLSSVLYKAACVACVGLEMTEELWLLSCVCRQKPIDRTGRNQTKDEQRRRAECPAVQQCFSEGISGESVGAKSFLPDCPLTHFSPPS